MSVRASTSPPSSCSGAMYWNVPTIAPSSVSCFFSVAMLVSATAALSAGLAKPKSSSFTPDFVSMMLPGFTSRWTTPALCAFSSASAICTP